MLDCKFSPAVEDSLVSILFLETLLFVPAFEVLDFLDSYEVLEDMDEVLTGAKGFAGISSISCSFG